MQFVQTKFGKSIIVDFSDYTLINRFKILPRGKQVLHYFAVSTNRPVLTVLICTLFTVIYTPNFISYTSSILVN